jgi:hypothetical protein
MFGALENITILKWMSILQLSATTTSAQETSNAIGTSGVKITIPTTAAPEKINAESVAKAALDRILISIANITPTMTMT